MTTGNASGRADRKRRSFERAKTFSDYLGFHIRLVFFVTIGLFALILSYLDAVDYAEQGLRYTPKIAFRNHPVEITVALLCFVYCLLMFWQICAVVFTYFAWAAGPWRITRLVSVLPATLVVGLTVLVLATISAYSSLQLVRSVGVQPDQFPCDLDRFLRTTDYPFTPQKPEYCDGR